MSIRFLLLILLLASTAATAAPHRKQGKTPPAAPQGIDVDAMARAKDVDANATGAAVPATPASEPAPDAAPAQDAADDASADPAVPTDAAAPAAATGPAEPPAPAASTPPVDATVPAAADPAAGAPIDPAMKQLVAACQARATALLDAAQKGDYAGATRDFDAKMRSALPEPKFRQAWESMDQFGALTARGQPHPMSSQGYVAITIPLLFEKANLYAQVACGSDGRIAGFYIKPLELPKP